MDYYEVVQKIDVLEYKINELIHKKDELIQRENDNLNLLANMQVMMNQMVNIMNMQNNVINQLGRESHDQLIKLTDIEIYNQNAESSFDEIRDAQQIVVASIDEVKTKVDNVRIIYYTE